jgi:hypothetical protein
VTVVAMSGPDNVGKSTQVRLLGRRTGMADLGALDAHDPRWPGAHSAGLAEWWFGAAPVSEVTDVLACSYLARAASGGNDHGMRLADRGVPMLEATVVATAAVREHLGHGAAAAGRRNCSRPTGGSWSKRRLPRPASCSCMTTIRRPALPARCPGRNRPPPVTPPISAP